MVPVVDASQGIISQSQSVMCNKRSRGRGSIFLALCLLLSAALCVFPHFCDPECQTVSLNSSTCFPHIFFFEQPVVLNFFGLNVRIFGEHKPQEKIGKTVRGASPQTIYFSTNHRYTLVCYQRIFGSWWNRG